MDSGIILEVQPVKLNNNNVLFCLLKGVLIYLGVFGTIGCYVSAFSIECNLPLLGILLFPISMYTAFLYYNKLTMNLGYPLLLILFLFAAVNFYRFVSSGFSAILNITYEAADNKLNLPAVKTFAELFTDRYISITYALAFIGSFGAILLNCAISGYMSFPAVFLMTFSIVQIGFYFDLIPGLPWLIMLSVCWFAVFIFKKSQHYKPEKKRKHPDPGSSSYGFYGPALAITGTWLAAVLLLLFLLLQLLIPQKYFYTPVSWNTYKDSTSDTVENFLMTGFSSFFNQYDAAGGISGGRLGGVRSISPDFKTDLLVKLVPYQYDTVYLKAFTGIYYHSDHWESADLTRFMTAAPYSLSPESAIAREVNVLQNKFLKDPASYIRTRMQITNLDADPAYIYLPYYTDVKKLADVYTNDSMVAGSSPYGRTYQAEYYPLLHPASKTNAQQTDTDSAYSDFVLDYYLQIPDELRPVLEEECVKAGFTGPEDDKINQVVSYLSKNFTYSMNPGTTPRKKDFVTYFLTRQKKGFCAHFASTAVLLLRNLGIPARYVEGYALPFRQISDSLPDEIAVYDDWLSGTSPIGKTGVVDVEVNDSMAHAWVEVYRPDFGWIPLEVTPASGSTDNSINSFWSMFTDLFKAPDQEASESGPAASMNGHTAGRYLSSALLILTAAIATLLLLLLCGRILYRRSTGKRCLMSHRYNDFIQYEHGCLLRLLYLCGIADSTNLSYGEFRELARTKLGLSQSEAADWISLIERAMFTREGVRAEEARNSILLYKRMAAACKEGKSLLKKVILYIKL